jgi:hypothetical protein
LLYVSLFGKAVNTGNTFVKRNCVSQKAVLVSAHISSWPFRNKFGVNAALLTEELTSWS